MENSSEYRPSDEDQELMLSLFQEGSTLDGIVEKARVPFMTAYKYVEAFKLGFDSPESRERYLSKMMETPVEDLPEKPPEEKSIWNRQDEVDGRFSVKISKKKTQNQYLQDEIPAREEGEITQILDQPKKYVWTEPDLMDALLTIRKAGMEPTRLSHPELYKESKKMLLSWVKIKKDARIKKAHGSEWTRDKVLDYLRSMKKLRINPSSNDRPGILWATKKFFGSWNKAKAEAGLGPLNGQYREKYSAADILDLLRSYRDRGVNPTYREFGEARHGANRIFGSINIAKEFIGMKHRQKIYADYPEHDTIIEYLKDNPSTLGQVRKHIRDAGNNLDDDQLRGMLHSNDIGKMGTRRNMIYFLKEDGVTRARKILDEKWKHRPHRIGTLDFDAQGLFEELMASPKTTSYLKERGLSLPYLERMQIAGKVTILKRPAYLPLSKNSYKIFRPGTWYVVPSGQERKFLSGVVRETKKYGVSGHRIKTGLKHYLKGIYSMENAIPKLRSL